LVDLLITGGLIVDGTGNPGYRASLAVQDERLQIIRAPGELPEAEARIDATGLVVAPGFIDMHSHSGLMIFDDPRHLPKVSQGVTTELIGIDGNSYAPFRERSDLEAFARMYAGLDGGPDLEYDWDSVASYLSRFDGRVSVNIAFLIGNSALRICAAGWEPTQADPDAVADMRAMLREGMQEGAFGLSTGLDYPPGSYATTEELIELGTEAGRWGGFYHTHLRNRLGDRFLDPIREAVEICLRGELPLHLTHLYQRATHPGGTAAIFGLIEDAMRDGVEVTFDTYPYEWSSTTLLIRIPQWVQAGGPDACVSRLASTRIRQAIREELEQAGELEAWLRQFDHIRVGNLRLPEHAGYEGRRVSEIAREREQDALETVCDLLVAEELRVNEVALGPNGTTLPRFVEHHLGMVGTDSIFVGERPSPRTWGAYPRILGDFVREERLLSLPEAVRKMTSFPAQRLGIADRGLLRDGLRADVAVFDPQRIRALATYDQPVRQSEGIEYVLVNGELVIDRGLHTGALPGRALRRGRR
jgi:N-acyl-D-amino-acid deacylase